MSKKLAPNTLQVICALHNCHDWARRDRGIKAKPARCRMRIWGSLRSSSAAPSLAGCHIGRDRPRATPICGMLKAIDKKNQKQVVDAVLLLRSCSELAKMKE